MMMMGRRRFSGGSWSVRNWLIGGARPPVVGACLSRRWVATAKAAPQMKLTAPEPLRMITGRAVQAARRTFKEASAHACMAYAGFVLRRCHDAHCGVRDVGAMGGVAEPHHPFRLGHARHVLDAQQ